MNGKRVRIPREPNAGRPWQPEVQNRRAAARPILGLPGGWRGGRGNGIQGREEPMTTTADRAATVDRRRVAAELERLVAHLRMTLRQAGFTQLEVQETVGWGHSYISQLFTRQKLLRVDQVLLILAVIGVEPAEFFREVYPPGARLIAEELRRMLEAEGWPPGSAGLLAAELEGLLTGLAKLPPRAAVDLVRPLRELLDKAAETYTR